MNSVRFIRFEHNGALNCIPPTTLDSVSDAFGTFGTLVDGGHRLFERALLLSELQSRGWSQKVKVDASSSITITSLQGRTGLCLQTGNVARMYADLLKLQLLFHREKLNAGILVVGNRPTSENDNKATYGRLVKELGIFREVVTVPLLVYGLEVR